MQGGHLFYFEVLGYIATLWADDFGSQIAF
jgi:hypothetical protein